jgi:hypothetical protein
MSNQWKRIKRQEGLPVFRWYEKGGIIASVVEGYFPDEANVRVSDVIGSFESFEIRGHKSIILKLSDPEILRVVEKHIGLRRKEKLI